MSFVNHLYFKCSSVRSQEGYLNAVNSCKYSWLFMTLFYLYVLTLIKSKDVHLVLGSINEACVSCVDRCSSSVICAVAVIDDLSTCTVRSIGQN